MIVDEAGALWLSNPLMTGLILTVAVGLVLWCHRWLESGDVPLPRNAALAARDRLITFRRSEQARDTRRATTGVMRIGGERRARLRTRQQVGAPRTAA